MPTSPRALGVWILSLGLLEAWGCDQARTDSGPDGSSSGSDAAAPDAATQNLDAGLAGDVSDGALADAEPADAGSDGTIPTDAGGDRTFPTDAGDASSACPADAGFVMYGPDGAPSNLPPCDPASQGEVCNFFESYATCIDGTWMVCNVGASPNRCLADATPPEGSPCCPYDYMPTLGPAILCCPGGRHVSCSFDNRIVWGGPCADASSDDAEAGD